jgi:hypothetical protein
MALLVADRPGNLSLVGLGATWVLLICALMCSGVGITMVALLTFVAFIRRGLRAAAVMVSYPLVVFLVWLVLIGKQFVGSTPVTATSLLALPRFIWTGISAALDGATGFAGAGAAITVGILAWLIWRRHDAMSQPVAFGGGLAVLVFFVIAGVGRASLGVDQALAARYSYVATILLAPVIAWMVGEVARRDRLAQAAVVVVIGFSTVQGFSLLTHIAKDQGLIKRQSERQIMAAARLLTSGTHHRGPPGPGLGPQPQRLPARAADPRRQAAGPPAASAHRRPQRDGGDANLTDSDAALPTRPGTNAGGVGHRGPPGVRRRRLRQP